MKIVVLTALWRRLPLAQLMIERLQRQGAVVLAVGSEGDASHAVAEAAGAHYVECANSPLSQKWSFGLQAARALDPDAILILGSDDFLCDRVLPRWRALLVDHSYIGLRDLYFYARPQLLHWKGYTNARQGEPIGAGRCLRRDLLDQMQWQLWPDGLNRGLDHGMTQQLAQRAPQHPVHLVTMSIDNTWIVDAKTDTALSQFERFYAGGELVEPGLLNERFGAGFRADLDCAVDASRVTPPKPTPTPDPVPGDQVMFLFDYRGERGLRTATVVGVHQDLLLDLRVHFEVQDRHPLRDKPIVLAVPPRTESSSSNVWFQWKRR